MSVVQGSALDEPRRCPKPAVALFGRGNGRAGGRSAPTASSLSQRRNTASSRRKGHQTSPPPRHPYSYRNHHHALRQCSRPSGKQPARPAYVPALSSSLCLRINPSASAEPGPLCRPETLLVHSRVSVRAAPELRKYLPCPKRVSRMLTKVANDSTTLPHRRASRPRPQMRPTRQRRHSVRVVS